MVSHMPKLQVCWVPDWPIFAARRELPSEITMTTPLPAPPLMQTGAHSAAQASSSRKTLIACSLGNALEMYDFTIYSFFLLC